MGFWLKAWAAPHWHDLLEWGLPTKCDRHRRAQVLEPQGNWITSNPSCKSGKVSQGGDCSLSSHCKQQKLLSKSPRGSSERKKVPLLSLPIVKVARAALLPAGHVASPGAPREQGSMVHTWTGTAVFLLCVLPRLFHPWKYLFGHGGRVKSRALGGVGRGSVAAGILRWRGRGRRWRRLCLLGRRRLRWGLRVREAGGLERLAGEGPHATLTDVIGLVVGHGAARGLEGARGAVVLSFHKWRRRRILLLTRIISETICSLVGVGTIDCRAVVVGRFLHFVVSQYLFRKLTGSWHPWRITLAPLCHVALFLQWPLRADLGCGESRAGWRNGTNPSYFQ